MEGAAGKTSGLETIRGFTRPRPRALVLGGLGWEADSPQVLTLYLSSTCVAAPLCSSCHYFTWFQRGLTGTGPLAEWAKGPHGLAACAWHTDDSSSDLTGVGSWLKPRKWHKHKMTALRSQVRPSSAHRGNRTGSASDRCLLDTGPRNSD